MITLSILIEDLMEFLGIGGWLLICAAVVFTGLLILLISIGYREFLAIPDPYDGAPRTSKQLLQDINEINAMNIAKCPNPGLSDPRWTCPQVTEDQARLMIARSMTKQIERNDATLNRQQRYTQGTREELTRALYDIISRMDYGNCVDNSGINLAPDILTEIERGGFIEKCPRGWNLTTPWFELIARQAPPPKPNWSLYGERFLD